MKYLKVFVDFADKIELLGDAERGRLFTAMLEYASSGAEPDLRGNERFIWPTAKSEIDRQAESYKSICETNKRIATERYGALRTVTERNEACQDKDKDKDKDKEQEKKNISFPPDGVKDSARAHRPTVEEVAAYCRERGNSVDAERFVDFYASKGWKVGNQPMKDWKACVRTWERREAPAEAPKKTAPARMPQGDDRDRLERLLANLEIKQNEKELQP